MAQAGPDELAPGKIGGWNSSRFDPESHLDGVLALFRAEGWRTLSEDRERTARALVAPGATTLVALIDDEVAGFAQALTDGEIQAYLVRLLVAPEARGRGIGRRLVAETLAWSGALRIDLLATKGGQQLYRSFPHKRLDGFRIYANSDQTRK